MKNILSRLKEIEEDFSGTVAAFGQLPINVVDATKLKDKGKVEKEESVKEEEIK